ncbi:MAG TPA: hypothetical protein ENN41_00550 [Sediminispirochaeta sp.]|nr:hypothetical protein [Sediminispirochaeta sp.]
MRTGRWLGLVIFIAGLFMSCENQGFLPPYEEQQPREVSSSVQTGDIVLMGQEIELSLEDARTENPPARMEIEILDREGQSLGVQSIEGEDLLEEIPPIRITSQEEGLMRLFIRLYDEADGLSDEWTINFFRLQDMPRILRLEAYPPNALSPEQQGLLLPILSGAEGAWLRWSMDDEPIARGDYADFEEGFVWTAPSFAGVYSIVLEVFPEAPPEGEDFDFPSPLREEVQFFVERGSFAEKAALQGGNYSRLFHFWGGLKDEGSEGEPPRLLGTPRPGVREGVFGYQLGADDGLILSDFPLSQVLDAENGGATVQFHFIADEAGLNNRHVFSLIDDEEGSSYLSLITDGEGRPRMEFPSLDLSWEMGVPSLSLCRETAVGLQRIDEVVLLKWYCHGRFVDSFRVPLDFFFAARSLNLQLGGGFGARDGVELLLDEFGLSRQGPEGVFQQWAHRNIGERDLLSAEGYENEVGDALQLGEARMMELFDLAADWPKTYVHLYFDEYFGTSAQQDGLSLLLRDDEGYQRRIALKEFELKAQNPTQASPRQVLRFSLDRENGAIHVADSEAGLLLEDVEFSPGPLRLYLAADGEAETEIRLEEMLLTKGAFDVSSREGEESDMYEKKLAIKTSSD